MFVFTILDNKQFMNLLLKSPVFNEFTFKQGEIQNELYLSIQGLKDDEFITELSTETYCLWKDIQPIVFSAIKGKSLPKIMKIVLSLKDKELEKFENTKSVALNILFRDNKLICTLSTLQSTFSLNKQGEQEWENYIIEFFKNNEILIEIEK